MAVFEATTTNGVTHVIGADYWVIDEESDLVMFYIVDDSNQSQEIGFTKMSETISLFELSEPDEEEDKLKPSLVGPVN